MLEAEGVTHEAFMRFCYTIVGFGFFKVVVLGVAIFYTPPWLAFMLAVLVLATAVFTVLVWLKLCRAD